jgi:hypothetical protein
VAPVRHRFAVALLALLASAPAVGVAARITGTAHNDRLVGTARADSLDGLAGDDTLLGLAGNDVLRGGPGRDRLVGGPGDDAIAANGDDSRDTISCGSGTDVVNADLGDSVAADCDVLSRQISTDTLTGGDGQHATEVEPDSFAFGGTMVTVFQVGRVEDGGATAIGVATTRDAGRHWRSGLLPGMTTLSPHPGTDPRASDPTVGFDAVHGVWLAAALGIASSGFQIVVSRSPDGIAWNQPIAVRAGASGSLDKEWVACDNWPASPNRGHCYLSYLDVSTGLIVTQTSTDGGVTWSAPVTTSGPPRARASANGAQPLPRPDGSLVVVYAVGAAEDDEEEGGDGYRTQAQADVLASTSSDGGASFGPSVEVSSLLVSPTPGLRAPPLPSADVADDGRLFVAWEDCRFDASCSRDRIVFSTSADGQVWTPPAPVGPDTPSADQFVPGLAVGPGPGGRGRVLAAAYYSMPHGCASRASCPGVDVWYTASSDDGRTWRAPRRLDAQPMRLDWLPRTSGGRFFGDYISTSFVEGKAIPVYSLAVTPFGGKLRQAIMILWTI